VPYGRVAVKLEVEIKSLVGTLSKVQRARRDELARAGALYVSAKSVASVVGQLVAAREALKWATLPTGFKGQVIQRGTGNMRAMAPYRKACGTFHIDGQPTVYNGPNLLII